MIGRATRRIVLSMPAGAAALTTLSAWRMARRMVAPDPATEKFVTPWELEIPYEDVEFNASDGLVLRGWWMPRASAQRTVIALGGHHGGKWDMLGIGAAMWRRGMNCLLFDYRGRGTSDPYINTLGLLETDDTLAAVEYALSRAPNLPIGLIGYSMGGAVSVMAAARDERIGAVVADSPFASQHEVIKMYIRNNLRWLPSSPAARLFESFLPYDVRKVEPIRDVSSLSPRAVMFIHGNCDTLTDPRDSEALYEAAGEPKELWLLPDVDHCGAYFADRVAYVERVGAFLERHLYAVDPLLTV